MDADIEKTQNLLLDAVDFPASVADVKNPSTDFIVNFIFKFLSRFFIDASTIHNSTFEQNQAMSYPEVFDAIIGFLNLYAAMFEICNRIFMKDFYILDITSPGPKRARRQIKVLLNFVLYSSNKISELEESRNNIYVRRKILNELIQKRNSIMDNCNQTALRRSKQLALKENYQKQINEIGLRMEKKNETDTLMEPDKIDAEQCRQEALQKAGSLKEVAVKLNEITVDLESKVVQSPEEYKAELLKLEGQITSQNERRVTMEDAIHQKKRLINQMEEITSFVQQQQCELFPALKENYQRLKSTNRESEESSKRVKDMAATLEKLSQNMVKQGITQYRVAEMDEISAEYDRRLSPLRNMYTQLLSEKKESEKRLEVGKICQHQMNQELIVTHRVIAKLEGKIDQFLKDCQELYDKEIGEELRCQSIWKLRKFS